MPVARRWTDRPRLATTGLIVAGLCSATALGEATVRSQLSAMVQSASDLIAQRSPGIRTRAIMGKGKMKGAPPTRLARALPRVRDTGGPEAPLPAAGPAALPDAFAALADAPAPAAVADAGAPGGAAVPGPGGWFLFAPIPGPGFGGGGGFPIIIGGPPGEEEPGPPVVPPPAVPEPSTWAMMLFGFGALGYALRRKTHGHSSTA